MPENTLTYEIHPVDRFLSTKIKIHTILKFLHVNI